MAEKPESIPMPVIMAIRRKFYPDGLQANRVLSALKWDGLNGCYYFYWAGMYCGVETDGYIHT